MGMDTRDVIIIGGGAGGVATALTLKALRPKLDVLLIRKGRAQAISCSFPFVMDADSALKNAGVELSVDEVTEIDRAAKLVRTSSGAEYGYKKLVLATGAKSAKLNVPGVDLDGVFTASTDFDQTMAVHEALNKRERIVIVGAGYIGIGFADELAGSREVHVVELLDEALALAFDREFGAFIRRSLESRGVKFHFKTSLKEIRGEGRVESVILDSGEEIPADAVLISVGLTPNGELARRAGLAVDEYGHVVVDSFMRTSDPDIYAVGDVAQKRDFFTGKPTRAYFSALAAAEGRVAAMHIAGVAPQRGIDGVIPAFAALFGGSCFAAAGLTEEAARRLGLSTLSVVVESVYSHTYTSPGNPLNVVKVTLKAVFSKSDLKLLGVQAVGPEPVNEMMNFAESAIRQGLTAYDIAAYTFASPPLWFRTPVTYPLQLAAVKALSRAVS